MDGIGNYKRMSKDQWSDLSDAVFCSSVPKPPKLRKFEAEDKENLVELDSKPSSSGDTKANSFVFTNCTVNLKVGK